MTATLQSHGAVSVESFQTADIIIINTCTVTLKADAKCRKIIKKARIDSPDALLIVCGCLVNTNKDDLTTFNEIDILVPNDDKDKLISCIDDFYQSSHNEPFYFETDLDGSFNFKPDNLHKHSRAFLKVQDGCDNRCSYCKIPFARGSSRSRPLSDIIDNISLLQQNGYEEIILSGINLGTWNENGLRLPGLINEIISSINGVRIRISSIEQQFIDTDFLDIVQSDRVCSHFHVPLQSGSDHILSLMNRSYTTEQFAEKIELLRDVKEDPFISTDLIVGFPGSTNDCFSETAAFIKKINFSYIHLFRYSPRNGTTAADMRPHIPERITKERMQQLKAVVKSLNYEYARQYIGKTVSCIIEKKNPGLVTARSNNYLEVIIKNGQSAERKKNYPVLISDVTNDGISGSIVE